MLGKLIKYEFKATVRIFAPLFAALLTVSLISKLMIGLQLKTPQVISLILSVMMIAAAFVITLILTVQRFYKNFLTDEGYLMFTLPVSTGRLIWSKLIVAAIWNITCAVVVFAAISIMALSEWEFRELWQSFAALGLPSLDAGLFIIEFCALVLVSLLVNILLIYASLGLSMYAVKHRIAFSFAIYIGLTTVIQILIGIVLMLFADPAMIYGSTLQAFFDSNIFVAIHVTAAVSLLVTLGFGAGLFAITRYMLKNRLNLQ